MYGKNRSNFWINPQVLKFGPVFPSRSKIELDRVGFDSKQVIIFIEPKHIHTVQSVNYVTEGKNQVTPQGVTFFDMING